MDIIRLLITEGADCNIADKKGYTPLHYASDRGDKITVKMLVENKVDLNAQTQAGDTALTLVNKKRRHNYSERRAIPASQRGNKTMVKMLVEENADLNVCTTGGQTALMLATLRGHVNIVKFLLDKGGDCNIKDMQECTALDYAERGAKSKQSVTLQSTSSQSGQAKIVHLLSGAQGKIADKQQHSDLRYAFQICHVPHLKPLAGNTGGFMAQSFTGKSAEKLTSETEQAQSLKPLYFREHKLSGFDRKLDAKLSATHFTASKNKGTKSDTFTQSPHNCILGGKWAFKGHFSSEGGTLVGENSDVKLHIPPDTLGKDQEMLIYGFVSTDYDSVRQKISLPTEGILITPVVEYHTDSHQPFQNHVCIQLPHVLDELHPVGVKAWTYRKDKYGKVIMQLLRHRTEVTDILQADEYWIEGAVNSDICIYTRHFSVYCCTICEKTSKVVPTIYFKVFGCHEQDGRNRKAKMEVYLWDKRLSIEDYFKNVKDALLPCGYVEVGRGVPVKVLRVLKTASTESEVELVLRPSKNCQPNLELEEECFFNQQVQFSEIVACCETKHPFCVYWRFVNKSQITSPNLNFEIIATHLYITESGEQFKDRPLKLPIEDFPVCHMYTPTPPHHDKTLAQVASDTLPLENAGAKIDEQDQNSSETAQMAASSDCGTEGSGAASLRDTNASEASGKTPLSDAAPSEGEPSHIDLLKAEATSRTPITDTATTLTETTEKLARMCLENPLPAKTMQSAGNFKFVCYNYNIQKATNVQAGDNGQLNVRSDHQLTGADDDSDDVSDEES